MDEENKDVSNLPVERELTEEELILAERVAKIDEREFYDVGIWEVKNLLTKRIGLLEKRFNALVEAVDKSKRFKDIKEN